MASNENFVSKAILGQAVTQPELEDMGQRSAAGKPVKPKMLNFASALVLVLNQWQDFCGTEKGNKE